MRFSLVIVVARVFINARFSFRFSFLHFLLFSCVFIFISFLVCLEREREMGGTDLRRIRADQVRLTKSRECFRSVVSRYHEIWAS